MRKFELEAVGMGTNNTGYVGAFPPAIQDLIKRTVSGKVLHLFSGSSLIGDERVDIEHLNATIHTDIRSFISIDDRKWLDFCAPVIKGFKREKLWLVLPGSFYTVRVLSWLKKEMSLLI